MDLTFLPGGASGLQGPKINSIAGQAMADQAQPESLPVTPNPQIMKEAGYDLASPESSRWGKVAYRFGYQAWKVHADALSTAHVETLTQIGFGPRILPRFKDQGLLKEDLETLSKLMERDPCFLGFGFSPKGVEAYLEKNPPNMNLSTPNASSRLSDIALKYYEATDDRQVFAAASEKFEQACTRASDENELRALALGLCLSSAFEIKGSPDKMLVELFFRKAVRDIYDPRLSTSTKKEAKASDGSEQKASVRNEADTLLDVICDADFPVKLPFVTALPFLIRIEELSRQGKSPNRKEDAAEMAKMMDEACSDLLDSDKKIYLALLEQWSKDNSQAVTKEETAKIGWLSAVNYLAKSLQEGTLSMFIDGLLSSVLAKGTFSYIHEQEARVLKPLLKSGPSKALLEQYASWLESVGHSDFAERTRKYLPRFS